jgi:MHS family proline/betaine transporter-like MFS transporter
VFGGFAPLISEMLITLSANISAPSFYLVFSAVISLIALVAAYRSGIR